MTTMTIKKVTEWVGPINAPPRMFWCRGHLTDRPTGDQSPDPRYCQGCYEFLVKEAELLSGKSKKAGWIPRQDTVLSGCVPLPVGEKGCDTAAHEVLQGTQVVTSQDDDVVTAKIGGMASQGMSCRAIEKELLKDNVTVSYRTIARRLKGQGVFV